MTENTVEEVDVRDVESESPNPVNYCCHYCLGCCLCSFNLCHCCYKDFLDRPYISNEQEYNKTICVLRMAFCIIPMFIILLLITIFIDIVIILPIWIMLIIMYLISMMCIFTCICIYTGKCTNKCCWYKDFIDNSSARFRERYKDKLDRNMYVQGYCCEYRQNNNGDLIYDFSDIRYPIICYRMKEVCPV